MYAMLSRRLRSLNDNTELDRLAASLAIIASDSKLSGGEEHRRLLQEFREARSSRSVTGQVSQFRSILQEFLSMLADYAADRTSISLGSNRANRAKEIDSSAFEGLDRNDCV